MTPDLAYALLLPGLRSYEDKTRGLVEFCMFVDPRDDSLWLAAHHHTTGRTEQSRICMMQELATERRLPFHDRAMILLAELGERVGALQSPN